MSIVRWKRTNLNCGPIFQHKNPWSSNVIYANKCAVSNSSHFTTTEDVKTLIKRRVVLDKSREFYSELSNPIHKMCIKRLHLCEVYVLFIRWQ